MSDIPQVQPTLGRVVRYMSLAVNALHVPAKIYVAYVIEVIDAAAGEITVRVMVPGMRDFERTCAFSKTPREGYWFWPDSVKP